MTNGPAPRSLLDPYRWGDAPTEAHLWALEVNRRRLRHRLIAEHPDPERRELLMAAEREMCRRDRVYWIEQWCWMYAPGVDPRYPDMMHVPAVLWEEQRKLHRWMDERWAAGEDWAVTKGRKLGVTWQHLFFVLHPFTLGRQFRARLLSSKQDGADDGTEECLFGMARYALRNLPSWLNEHNPDKEYSKLYLGCKATDGQIVGESASAGVSRGLRTGLFLLDEFAHFSYESIALQVLASTHSVARCRAFISTPKGPASEFAQLRARMPEHCVYHMTWRADPRKPADYREQMIRAGMRPDLFEQEEEGRDVALSEQLMFSGPPNLELLPAWEKEPGDRRGPRPSRNIRALEYWDEEDDFRAVQAEEDILHRGFLAGGWDFGTSGVSALVCLHAVVEPGPRWRLWIDAEHKWHQTAWMSAADDVLSWVRYRYCPREPNHWGHWGDPAGIQTESDGSNWQNNLRSGGVPLTALHASYNTRDGQEWAFREAQSLIDAGRIRVHRRCTYLWSCLENWSRDIPHGSNPELISKLYIPPRHDGWSHGGMAFAYLLAGVLIGMSAAHDRSDQALATLPPAPGGSIASMLEMGG